MRDKVINTLLVLLSSLFTILVLEIGIRIYNSEFRLDNFLELKRDLFRSAYPTQFDTELGWIPKKGDHPANIWNTKVTILEDGIRSNGAAGHAGIGDSILAVGDSFTFGDEVSDDETWPARLEKISGKRVINGGVFGYGVDQTYLRMRALGRKYKPDIIIFSLIPSDINRCELSERTSVPKPYFVLSESNELILMDEHVRKYIPPEDALEFPRSVMGYSFLIHQLMSKVLPEYWLQGAWKSTRLHSDGTVITCRIFDKLKSYSLEEKVELYVLIQYGKNFDGDLELVDQVTACIDQDVLNLIDLRNSLAAVREHDIDRYKSLFRQHMTEAGNSFVASILWRKISGQN
jgi:hypothetical protein